MIGTIAPTDYGWYRHLCDGGPHDEVNFWRPSAQKRFLAERFSPFLFKLKAPHNAICGFGYFATYTALPVWLAWDTFGSENGCADRESMEERIRTIRDRMRYRGEVPAEQIGCILVVQPVFFAESDWVPQPGNWPARNLTPMRWDLARGEGKRVWSACLARAACPEPPSPESEALVAGEGAIRFGALQIVRPRLGQGTFRIEVTDAYERACAVTGEHSLPALDAAHIRPYASDGVHETRNGILLRADFHRLFDQGYVTVTPELRLEVSRRLREEYENGRSYYPSHGAAVRAPRASHDRPDRALLAWHNERVFRR
jgi:putative restriction endonuclease